MYMYVAGVGWRWRELTAQGEVSKTGVVEPRLTLPVEDRTGLAGMLRRLQTRETYGDCANQSMSVFTLTTKPHSLGCWALCFAYDATGANWRLPFT
jgi:hypothetical protein